MKKNNLTQKDGLALLIERPAYKGKLHHTQLNKNQDDIDCYVVYNKAIGDYQYHIWHKHSHIVSPFISSNYESYRDGWVYEDDAPEVDEPQPNHIEYCADIDYLLTQTSERSLIDSLLDYMSDSDIDKLFKRFMW